MLVNVPMVWKSHLYWTLKVLRQNAFQLKRICIQVTLTV